MPDERPEVFRAEAATFPVVEKPLGTLERLYGNGTFRKAVLLLILATAWEMFARSRNNPLLLPSFTETVAALFRSVSSGEMTRTAVYTINMLLKGYAAGVFFAAILTALASATRVGADLLETLTAMFNPLPSIALLPLAMIWFGLGSVSVIFVLIHAVLWAVALNTHAGFRAVSPTLRMVGQNYGLSRAGYITRILVPAAFPSILTGLKVGWAFAWRTLIAAELVFGASSESGGLGWFINAKKNELLIPSMFAGLLTIILFGLLIENLVFKTIESRTVKRWGMQV
jgi:NitT/TauT family transport system permease protein